MITLSKVMLCSDFNKKERPFATLFFVKSGKGSKLASCALSSRAYTFGIDVTGIVSPKFWSKDEDEKLEEVENYFNETDFEEEGLRCYDITVLDVTGGQYKAVNFDENTLETFHRAFIGSRDECLSDLRRQFEKNKDKWDLVEALHNKGVESEDSLPLRVKALHLDLTLVVLLIYSFLSTLYINL